MQDLIPCQSSPTTFPFDPPVTSHTNNISNCTKANIVAPTAGCMIMEKISLKFVEQKQATRIAFI